MSERPVKAYVLAIVKRGTEHEVAERIRKVRGRYRGSHNLWDVGYLARVETESLEKLDKIVTEIRKLPEIEQTNMLIGA